MAKHYLFNKQTNTFLTDDTDKPVEITETKKKNYENIFNLTNITHLVFMDADELAIHEYNARIIRHDG